MKTSITIEITSNELGYQIHATWTNEAGPASSTRWVAADDPDALEQVQRISRDLFDRAIAAQARLLAR